MARACSSVRQWCSFSGPRTHSAATSTTWAPWFVVDGDNKKRARLNVIRHILDQIPYEPLPERTVTLPVRQEPEDYVEPDLSALRIESRY